MDQNAEVMSLDSMINATARAKRCATNTIKLAQSIVDDTEKKQRKELCQCKSCYYNTSWGGNSHVFKPCMSCGTKQLYSSTDVDVLCLDCAKEHSLCKKCGGDLEMRERRRNWPVPHNQEQEIVNEIGR